MSPSTPRRSTRVWPILAAAFSLAGCHTLVAVAPLEDQLTPLDLALSAPIASVEADAEGGDANAQVAMWLIRSHGLNGARMQPMSAELWRQRAQSNHRVQPITQYTAAFNGQPSRVNIINVPMQTIPSAQWSALEACVSLLAGSPGSDGRACGDDEALSRRQFAWRRAVP